MKDDAWRRLIIKVLPTALLAALCSYAALGQESQPQPGNASGRIHKCEGLIDPAKFTSTTVSMVTRDDSASRMYLTREMPNLCQSQTCKKSVYINREDRVEVGYACGPWAAVRFKSRNGHLIYGWVDAEPLILSPANDDAGESILNAIRGLSLDFNDHI